MNCFEHPQDGEKATVYLQIIDMLILDNSFLGIKPNLMRTTSMMVVLWLVWMVSGTCNFFQRLYFSENIL